MIEKASRSRLHDVVNDALAQWVAIMGADPGESDRNNVSWAAGVSFRELEEAQALDETGLTTCMLLRAMVEDYVLDHAVTLHAILNDPASVEADVAPCRKLIQTLEADWITKEIDTLVQWMKNAVAHYKVDAEGWDQAFDNKMTLAWLRRDALRSFEGMRAHQFSFGECDDVPIKYNEKIVQFWNVNSLLSAIGNSPVSGVTICVVRDPDVPQFSYFTFAVRNGGNLILLTDKADEAHPQYKFMTRKPGRNLEKRMGKHHFPYQYIGAEYTSNSDHARLKGTPGLVKYQSKADSIGLFSKMEPDQVIWAILLLEKISEAYWANSKILPEQSFTGEMIQEPYALLSRVDHLPAIRRDVLEMPKVAIGDIDADVLEKEGQWEGRYGRRPNGHNRWMEDRYKHLVTPEQMNPIGNDQIPLLTVDNEAQEFSWRGNPVVKKLTALEPTAFGTRAELEKDYKWHARHNMACVVDNAAKEEFNKNKDEMIAWFKEHVEGNAKALEEAIGKGELISTVQAAGGSFDWSKNASGNILDVFTSTNQRNVYPGFCLMKSWKTFGEMRPNWHPACYKTGGKATVFARFTLMTPFAVADVCGVKYDDLPFFLKQYFVNEPYVGNSILDRIDPMEWQAMNPWRKLDLGVVFFMTKTAYNGLRKAAGNKKFTDWKSIEKHE